MHFTGGGNKEQRAVLAREANTARRRVLDELRAGGLWGGPLDQASVGHPLDQSFKKLIEEYFYKLLNDVD